MFERNCKVAVETVLRSLGRPATAGEIADAIKESGALSKALGGLTPHKTIQARISTDIRRHGSDSKFYRFAPATFGLRELAENGAYENNFRKIYIGRDRRREIDTTPVLCFQNSDMKLKLQNKMLPASILPMRFWKSLRQYFVSPKYIKTGNFTEATLFIVVRHLDDVICYEPTEYDKKNREITSFSSIGLNGSIRESDIDLFDKSGVGFENANIRELKSFFYFLSIDLEKDIRDIRYVGVISDEVSPERANKVAMISEVRVSERFVLSDTILGITNLHWRPLRYIPNSFTQLDSWSQFTFRYLHERLQTENILTSFSQFFKSRDITTSTALMDR
jgi:hypothetical protein